MKMWILLLSCLALTVPALAVDKSELDYRLRTYAQKLETLQSKPDKRIPAETLRKAKGVIMLDRTKAGFIFAYQGGGGVAMVKDRSGKWSAPAFLNATEASLGFQIGGQQSFVVVLLMNTNTATMVAEGDFKFGGEASGTAGNASGKAEGVVGGPEPLMLVYSDRSGLYGGAALKGDALSPNTDANFAYYGQYLTTREILVEGKAKPTEAAKQLADKINQFAK